MQFEQPMWPYNTGRILGYVGAYALFTTILWLILWAVKGHAIHYVAVVLITVAVLVVGEGVRWLLK